MEDFDGWEVLPDDGFLQIHDDGGKRIYSRSYGPGSRCVYKDYFICPDSKSTKFVEKTEQEQQEEQYPRSRVVSIQLENSPDHNQEDLKIITEAPFEKAINQSPPLLLENLKETEESDPDPVLQVLYKKMMEPEFVDMKKLESPTRNMKPPPFPVDSTTFQLVDEGKGESFDMKISSPNSLMKVEEEKIITHSGSGNNNGGFNIWKWSLTTGIGAICSFGIATATVCIIFLGAHQRNTTKQQQSKEKRNLQFHIYTDEKKLKEAAMRGSGRAHITFGGGYYDELFE